MTPERRAEVVELLLRGVRDSIADARAKWAERGAAVSVAQCDAEDAAVLEAAEELRAFAVVMEHIRNSVRGARIGLAQEGPGWMREWFDGIERRASEALGQ